MNLRKVIFSFYMYLLAESTKIYFSEIMEFHNRKRITRYGHRVSNENRSRLLNWARKNPRPSPEDIQTYAQFTNEEPRTIRMWFYRYRKGLLKYAGEI
jgi:hypothetical protein